jgi:septal ring factor EnvC (AmiA/AmiB activator)
MKHGPSVLPGNYDIVLKCGDFEMSKKVEVELDPALSVSHQELKARHDALIDIYKLNPILQELRKTAESIKAELSALKSKLEDNQNTPEEIQEKIDAIQKEIEKIHAQVYGDPENPNHRRYFSIVSLQRIAASLERFTEAPSPSEQEFIRKKSGELRTVIDGMNRVLQLAIPELNALLIEHKIPQLTIREAIKGF